MKRVLSIVLALALVLGLAACTSGGGQPAEPASVEDQIALLVANKDLWYQDAEDYTPFYGVTDLDGNGRLELIRCVPGDDWWDTDTFYAVSEDCKEVKELAFPFGEDHSHPDFVDFDQFRMYIGPEGRYLIANDDIYMGPSQASDYTAYHVLDYITLTDEGVEAGDIAWCMMRDEDTNGDGLSEYHISYYPGGDVDEEKDGDWYITAPSEQFPGYEEQVCSISWWSVGYETPADDEAIRTGLANSWEGFSVAPDAEAFVSLEEDPYYDFYAAGAGGAHIYQAGEEVPYFPSYWDIKGTWYLQNAWVDGATWYVGKELSAGELNITESGQLYMDYSNTADPRGAYLITEMNMTRDSRAEGTSADDWVIVYESDDGMWELQLRPDLDRGLLYVTWYEWPDGDRSLDPTGINLEYSRAAG